MKFSVVIPSYNQQEYLPDAIDSVLEQTIDTEIIVVDDGSTDNSLEIAKSYQVEHNSRPHKYDFKVISQVNKGLSSSRNTGIMNATGEYVLFLDADDLLLDKCVEKMSQYKTDIISPSFRTFGTTAQEVILMPNPTLEDFKTGNRLGCCSAVKRSALLAVGGYSPRMTWGYEDYALWINLLSRGYTVTTIPEILWLYRTKEKSMIHDAQAHHEELMKQINKDFKLW